MLGLKSNTIEAQLEQSRLESEPPIEFARARTALMESEKRKETVKASAEVLENYERELEHFGKWLATTHPEVKALRQVAVAMTKSYRKHLSSSGRSTNTVNKYLSGLMLIWNILKEEARIIDNPWTQVC